MSIHLRYDGVDYRLSDGVDADRLADQIAKARKTGDLDCWVDLETTNGAIKILITATTAVTIRVPNPPVMF